MRLEEIDPNFKLSTVTEADVEWLDLSRRTDLVFGVYYSREDGKFRRLPKKIAEQANVAVREHAVSLAGGRIRFRTNSPYVAISCLTPFHDIMPHITVLSQFGFALRENGDYRKLISPSYGEIVNARDGIVSFDGIYYTSKKGETNEYEIYMPLYGGANRILLGVRENSVVQAVSPRIHSKPVVFYGSSITQGGCASRPDNDYASVVCRWLDAEYLNFGFSGGAKGESAIADHLAAQNASVFVLDYDHNAPDATYLKETHYPLFQRIREKHPNTPVLFMTKPDCDYDLNAQERAAVVRATYQKAMEAGDKNVAFIDGKLLFGEEDRSVCTVDGVHPNDVGFYRMAKVVYPVLKKLLDENF